MIYFPIKKSNFSFSFFFCSNIKIIVFYFDFAFVFAQSHQKFILTKFAKKILRE